MSVASFEECADSKQPLQNTCRHGSRRGSVNTLLQAAQDTLDILHHAHYLVSDDQNAHVQLLKSDNNYVLFYVEIVYTIYT